ncbi:MAG: YceI family protein [Actinomycetota bacterium]|nr:YceI family protein [Actinomycetota bacterium]
MNTSTTTPTATSDRIAAGTTDPAPGSYQIDPSHSSLEAVARHLMVSKVRGRFGDFGGTIVVADDVTQSRVEVEIDAASINTHDVQRDGHLRSDDFLDVERFGKLRFVSTQVERVGSDWKVRGDLTIRDVTQAVTLDVSYLGQLSDPWGNTRAAFSATTQLDRESFGMTWNQALEAGGVVVGKTLNIELEIEAVLQAE